METEHTLAFDQMLVPAGRMENHYLNQLFEIYHQRLLENAKVCQFLERRGIDYDAIKKYRIGFCDRSLNRFISTSAKRDGAAFRGTLRQLELFKESGHELFRGCVVEPMIVDGTIVAACGIKLRKPSRPAARLLQWYRHSVYPEPVTFHIMVWGKRYVTH